jgi:Flp pilus assembly protein TadB
MNFETLIPIVGWLVIVAIIAAPVASRLVTNLRTVRRIRQHKKNLPGPLLGVVYPEHKNSTIYRANRED